MSDRTRKVLSLIPYWPESITRRRIRKITGPGKGTIEMELRQIANMPGIMLCQDDEDEFGLSLVRRN